MTVFFCSVSTNVLVLWHLVCSIRDDKRINSIINGNLHMISSCYMSFVFELILTMPRIVVFSDFLVAVAHMEGKKDKKSVEQK